MPALEFGVTPTLTGDGIVVSLLPDTKLLPFKPVLPNPVRPSPHPLHPLYFLFGIIKGDAHEVGRVFYKITVFQPGKPAWLEYPFHPKTVFLVRRRYDIFIALTELLKLFQNDFTVR